MKCFMHKGLSVFKNVVFFHFISAYDFLTCFSSAFWELWGTEGRTGNGTGPESKERSIGRKTAAENGRTQDVVLSGRGMFLD